MSSHVTIIAIIIVLIAVLMCYAFFAQMASSRKQRKERLLSGLKARARNFHFILENLPLGPLSKDLILFVQTRSVSVYEQLTQLEPSNAQHKSAMNALNENKAQTKQFSVSPENHKGLEDPNKLGEMKSCLEQLYKYVQQLESKGEVGSKQSNSYRAQIKRVLTSATIDAQLIYAKQAEEKGNLALAMQQLQRCLDMITKEGRDPSLQKRAGPIQNKIGKIKESDEYKAQQSQAEQVPNANPKEAVEDSWKKKQVYD